MTSHDFDTRLGRVAIAWHLEAAGIDEIIVTPAERAAYRSAKYGLDMTPDELAALKQAVKRMAVE